MSEGLGISQGLYSIRFHLVFTKGLPVFHPFIADPENVPIGFIAEVFANSLAQSTHWCQKALS
jgi:hypothetical protein